MPDATTAAGQSLRTVPLPDGLDPEVLREVLLRGVHRAWGAGMRPGTADPIARDMLAIQVVPPLDLMLHEPSSDVLSFLPPSGTRIGAGRYLTYADPCLEVPGLPGTYAVIVLAMGNRHNPDIFAYAVMPPRGATEPEPTIWVMDGSAGDQCVLADHAQVIGALISQANRPATTSASA